MLPRHGQAFRVNIQVPGDHKGGNVNKGADLETALVGIRDVNRPGLQLVGFFDYFDPRRLQVIGMAETKMLESMDPDK